MPKTFAIGTIGPDYAFRYHITDMDGSYWSDEAGCWTRNIGNASLWADQCEVVARIRDLMLEHTPGQLVKFVAPMFVELKTPAPVSLEVMKAWLSQNVQVRFDASNGTGPIADSMTIIELNWEELKENRDE